MFVNKGHHAIIISGMLIALLAITIPLSTESFAKPDKCLTWPNCDDKGGGGGKTSFDFDVTLFSNSNPITSISIDQGDSKTIDVLVSQISGSGNVNLSTANALSGVTVSFDPSSSKVSSRIPSYTSTMTIDVSSTANSGTINVQASGKGITKTTTLNLDVIVVTPPPPPSNDPVIVAAGDIACNTSSSTSSTCHHQATSDLIMTINPIAVLTLGDNQYQNGELSNYNTYYGPTWGRVFDKTHPSPGNHEYGTSYAGGYFDYFGTRAGDTENGYYSYNVGSWHIVSLNSNCTEEGVGGCSTTSPQGVWLKNDLETHNNACTLAYWHHPTFSAGSHGDNSKMDYFWQLLDANNVDVALAGHDHNYQRFTPMDLTGSEDPNGVREFVVGTGGKSHYSLDPNVHSTLEAYNTSTYGVLKMTLHDTSYDWEFVGETGNIIDSGTWNCNVN